jgi:hypothetical protein
LPASRTLVWTGTHSLSIAEPAAVLLAPGKALLQDTAGDQGLLDGELLSTGQG